MAIATTTALVALGAVSAGAQAYGAHKAAGAAKDAARTQADSANQALGMQRQIYDDQRQMQAPWVAAGQGAANTLGRLTGAPAGSTFAAPAPTMSGAGQPLQQQRQTMVPTTPANQIGGPGGGNTLGGLAAPSYAPASGGLVKVQSPDGETRMMPQVVADRYVQRGARIVG